MSAVIHYYRQPCLSEAQTEQLLQESKASIAKGFVSIATEFCYNVELTAPLTADDKQKLVFLMSETFEQDKFGEETFLIATDDQQVVEVGPRLNFSTAWSSNAISICQSCGLTQVTRLERSRRYQVAGEGLTQEDMDAFVRSVHDKMTEQPYADTLGSFESGVKPAEVYNIPVLSEGRSALEKVNKELGLGFDSQDLDYYTNLFLNKIKRDPTSVEAFDMAQSNSEHSRHWYFNAKMIIDGQEKPSTLFQLVKEPLKQSKNSNSTIGFHDNSSAMEGFEIDTLLPSKPGQVGPMQHAKVNYDLTFTAETHNFPTGVCPRNGAETGPGGRIRDGHSTGTGSLVLAGTAAYCVGNLNIPGYELPWENKDFQYPPSLAPPLQIITDASDGASDYGNKFGEPMIQGYTRSYGLRDAAGERREWIKPIMFTAGVGQMDARHRKKGAPEKGMKIIKIGGPAYRIGMGGGAASSMLQGDNAAHLDFNAVQRGDAEMEQKMNRVVRACVELGAANPIVSIHDQGCGGNGNVLKEICEPAGAIIDIRDVLSGDATLSVLELWGAEFQENSAILLSADDVHIIDAFCSREKCPYSVVGTVTGDGHVVVHDRENDTTPYNLALDDVLGKLPSKTFELESFTPKLPPLVLPADLTMDAALDRVLRLLSVGSKRFLTSKVDRSVTGLIAQQQCVGPLQLTLSDVAVICQSHYVTTGCAIAIGEQPIKGMVNMAAMARMSVAESLTNLVWAKITSLDKVKASGNWMWAAKLPGEGAAMYKAAEAMSEMMIELGVALDGGKDSLSMAARANNETTNEMELVKCPGALVISAYAPCPDVTKVCTPDLKLPGAGVLLFASLGSQTRLGGSALAQVFKQLGDTCPDVEDAPLLKAAFDTIQELVASRTITAGHDRSDGGLITTVLEMAFAGNVGVTLEVDGTAPMVDFFFNEEVGFVMEVAPAQKDAVLAAFAAANVPCSAIGHVNVGPDVKVTYNKTTVLEGDIRKLRDQWEATSFELEMRQTAPACATQEKEGLFHRKTPNWSLTYEPKLTPTISQRHKVAIIRQEGSNGDREMCSAFDLAGFEAWDVHMSDLLGGKVDLTQFRGVVFVGGFSYADVMDSAKGWAATIKFNPALTKAFEDFRQRTDTFSLGICNGCQLMALLGWVPVTGTALEKQPRFIHNKSGRFESRFVNLKVEKSPAIMLKGMEGSCLGVWIAHGEGQAYFPEETVLTQVLDKGLAPVRYVDDDANVTQAYPFNPNGAAHGIAGLCSEDGRHLCMMPHPERTALQWQFPYQPEDWKTLEASPWLKFFQNAREWCDAN
jgi:phosphoribosylformylglycinamidine synthase